MQVSDDSLDRETVEAIGSTIENTRTALEALAEQLHYANTALSRARRVLITEEELGHLFQRAQEFADTSAYEAEDAARQMVAAGQAEANRIVTEAREQARTITEGARQAALSPDALRQLQTTIDWFRQVNGDLVSELSELRVRIGASPAPSAASEAPETTQNRTYTNQFTGAAPPPPIGHSTHGGDHVDPYRGENADEPAACPTREGNPADAYAPPPVGPPRTAPSRFESRWSPATTHDPPWARATSFDWPPPKDDRPTSPASNLAEDSYAPRPTANGDDGHRHGTTARPQEAPSEVDTNPPWVTPEQ